MFTHTTSLLHRVNLLGLFFSKTKIRYIFSFHRSFGVLIFTFDMCLRMTYLFCIIKNIRNNITCTTEGEKLNKCCGRNHTILFGCLRGTTQEYLFHSDQCFHSQRKFTQRRRNFLPEVALALRQLNPIHKKGP